MGVELCIRHKDHVVIVMPYFPHRKFQVNLSRSCKRRGVWRIEPPVSYFGYL